MEGFLGFYTIFSLMTGNTPHNIKMAEKDLKIFLKKIEQLNMIKEMIENNPLKKKELSDCKNHLEVISLTSKWGFEISKRWGEY